MFVGSCASRIIPVLVIAPNKVLNLINIVGAGLLVGVALIIIIPKDMITLNQALTAQQGNGSQTSEPQIQFIDTPVYQINSTTEYCTEASDANSDETV